MTQVRSDWAMPRSVWIAGSATFTTDPSIVFMNIARQTTHERDPAPAVPHPGGGCGELGQLATGTAAPAAVGR